MKKALSLAIALALLLSLALTAPIATADAAPVTLKILTPTAASVEDFKTNAFSVWMEEKLGVSFEWITIPYEQRQEKLNIVMLSDDLPDVFYNCPINAEAEVKYGTEALKLLPLKELIGNYPNLKKEFDTFKPDGEVWKLMTCPDGEIYSIPTLTDCYHCYEPSKMWVNGDWMERLGAAYPTTLDEFYNLLVRFKNEDPNGDGDTTNDIPLMGMNDSTQFDQWIMQSFLYTNWALNASTLPGFALRDTQIISTLTQPEFREGIRFLNKLWKEGLIYEASFSQTWEQGMAVVMSNDPDKINVGFAAGLTIPAQSYGDDWYKRFRPVSPVAGPQGVRGSMSDPYGYYWLGRFSIAANSKNVDKAMQMADLIYTWDATMFLRRGVKGTDWGDPDPDTVGIDGEPALWKQLTPWGTQEIQNNSFVDRGPFVESSAMRLGQQTEANIDIYSTDGLEQLLYQVTRDNYVPFNMKKFAVPRMRYTQAETDSITSQQTELLNYVKQSYVAFVMGDMDIETQWDEYVAQIETLGMNDVIAVMQTVYDRQFLGK